LYPFNPLLSRSQFELEPDKLETSKFLFIAAAASLERDQLFLLDVEVSTKQKLGIDNRSRARSILSKSIDILKQLIFVSIVDIQVEKIST
jgi:hypothetical protein